jgi:hypothetical protein
MLLGVLGTQEVIVLIILPILIIGLIFRFVYNYGKQKGRIQELEKKKDNS